ncbi:MAG: 6-phosphogluconolactonase [Thermoplasmata archaeon]|nr:6-phosphogluconolactonase [Thermoplasmata archaeon]
MSGPLAERVARSARAAVRERGRFSWVLAGGKTPQALYRCLAEHHRRDVPWANTEVFFGDERCVGPHHPDSNFGAAWESFLSRVPVRRNRVHRIVGERTPPSEAARAYARRLGSSLLTGSGPPRFDLVLLGVGPDGHTASLFPGSAAVHERRRSVVAVARAGQPPHVPRITLTVPSLASSRELWFLAAGPDKAEAIRRVFDAPPEGDAETPASLVWSRGPVDWFLDEAAAANLPNSVLRAGSA